MEIIEFLERTPPMLSKLITNLATRIPSIDGALINPVYFEIPFNDIYIYCPSEICKGKRKFKCTNKSNRPHLDKDYNNYFLQYKCRNCGEHLKYFALMIKLNKDDETVCDVIKMGEWPTFGPRTPGRFIKLIGPDKELFLKGRQAEIMGLGIGSFTYYRRVVENQKNRLIDSIINVAKKIDYPQKLIKILEEAKKEDQFSKSIDLIKDNIPQQLFIDGHNPLTQIHKALSVGIHKLNDEECLDYATSIRTVLFELSNSISTALKERSTLKSAIGILNRKKK